MENLALQRNLGGLTRVSAAVVTLTTVDAATLASVVAQRGTITAVFEAGVGTHVHIPGFVNDGGDVVHVTAIDDGTGASTLAKWYPEDNGKIIVIAVAVPGAFCVTHFHIPPA